MTPSPDSLLRIEQKQNDLIMSENFVIENASAQSILFYFLFRVDLNVTVYIDTWLNINSLTCNSSQKENGELLPFGEKSEEISCFFQGLCLSLFQSFPRRSW